jgi:hypothetical protein
MSVAATAVPSPLSWIGEAIRQPEELVRRWRDRHALPEKRPGAEIFFVLAITGLLGLAVYGFTMGIPMGLGSVGRHALIVPLGAALAWSLCLPSLYIFYAVSGSTLDRSTTLLAALTAFCFGSVARLASAPLSWFFGLALPIPAVLTALHLFVFGITALAMLYTFVRVMRSVAPQVHPVVPFLWLCCVGVIDVELKALMSVFVL